MRRLIGTALLALASAAAAAPAQPPARFDWFDYRGDDGLPKPAPGEYANPILQGFYPDPSMVRVGDDYYLVNSTFGWFPGIPVWHSRDLVSWTQIGNAIDRPGQLKLDGMSMGQGVFAPDISWHDGTFYILNTCIGCGGNFVITAKNPAGPWSDPVFLPDVDGIDTSMFFDADGSAWIVHNAPPQGTPEYPGHTAIWLQQFDLKTLKTFGPKRLLVDKGTHPERKPIWIEGPHIIRKDGAYYLVAAEGGTAEQHSEVVFKSDRVTGPYVPFAGNPILTQRDLPADRRQPITSTGHASFVETPRGEWWTVFLGVRPYDAQNFNTGRETFLARVRWQGGWPHVTEPGERVPWVAERPDLPRQPKPKLPTNGAFDVREDFSTAGLPSGWMLLGDPHGQWWRISGGQLALQAQPVALGSGPNPSLLARRQQHQHFVATAKVRFTPVSDDAEAGMVAMQNPDYWYGLLVGRDGGRRVIRVRRRAGGGDPLVGTILASAPLPDGPVELRIAGHGAAYDFSWSSDGGHWHPLLSGADGTILSTTRAGGFVGAVLGVYAHTAVP
jgi:alpha-N-arabinofuranosidase